MVVLVAVTQFHTVDAQATQAVLVVAHHLLITQALPKMAVLELSQAKGQDTQLVKLLEMMVVLVVFVHLTELVEVAVLVLPVLMLAVVEILAVLVNNTISLVHKYTMLVAVADILAVVPTIGHGQLTL